MWNVLSPDVVTAEIRDVFKKRLSAHDQGPSLNTLLSVYIYIYTYIYIYILYYIYIYTSGLPGFARDSCSKIISISAFYF